MYFVFYKCILFIYLLTLYSIIIRSLVKIIFIPHMFLTAQTYGLHQLLQKCIDFVRCKSFTELQKDPYFKRLEPGNLIHILQLRVLDLESTIEQVRELYTL